MNEPRWGAPCFEASAGASGMMLEDEAGSFMGSWHGGTSFVLDEQYPSFRNPSQMHHVDID